MVIHIPLPTEALRRLELTAWLLGKVKQVVDMIPPDVMKAILATARPWPADKMKDIKSKFLPKEPASGMGCMAACYDMLSILYSPDVKADLLKKVLDQAMERAKADAARNPAKLNAIMDRLKAEAVAKGTPITDGAARTAALWEMTSPHNSADHLFQMMEKEGKASEPAVLAYDAKTSSWSPGADQAISSMTGDQPGVYFFGVSVSDYHTVTLAVERKEDGTQKMYWFDQHQKGLSYEVPAGKLGETLQGVRGAQSTTTRIWAFQPPAQNP